MMIMRYNFEKHTHEPFEIPDNVVMIPDVPFQANTPAICCVCHKKLPLGSMKASLTMHSDFGSYPVCQQCFLAEYKQRKLYESD